MKKSILTIILSFLFIFSLFGCEKKTVKPTTTTKANESSETTTKKELTIKYYDGGEMIKTEKYTKDNFNLFTPEKNGFTFLGWFKDQALTQEFNASELDALLEQGTLSLYAAWETTDLFNISINGSVGEKMVINPAFTWKNNFNDTEFEVKIMKGTNKEDEKTSSDLYFVSPLLDFNTTYKFVIEGKTSHKVQEIEFTTIEKDDSYNTKKQVEVCDPYMSNMVIQRGETISLNGVGPQLVSLAIQFGNEMYFTMTDAEGKYQIDIPAHDASFDPIDIVIGLRLTKRVTLNNVLIGDVYLFTGQSNMQWGAGSSDIEQSDVQLAIDNDVRYFTQGVTTSNEPKEHVSNARWFTITSSNYQSYSALAFMSGALLGDYLKKEANVPLGILTAYQGDTNIANWMGKGYYTGTASTKHLHYNAMVYPLRAAKIKGVVWYQGCNNSAAGGDYKEYLTAYFRNYRELFNNEELKFYVIGLACYDGDSGNNYDFSFVRESQAAACAEDDKAYFISTCDDGDPTFIHPRHKRYIALRIFKSIASSMYGADYLSEGPSYKSHTVEGNVVTIEFNNAEGLKVVGELTNLFLAGEDGKYFPAEASIVDGKIVASTPKVEHPVYIKYGFGKSPFTTVFNKDDYSLVPFRTDNHNINIDLLDYSTIDAYTFHPDGDDMVIDIVNDNLKIQKKSGSKGYGSVRLSKWGMIAYEAIGFSFSVIGTNSGATIQFRVVEGPSGEIWGFEIKDDFEGPRTFDGSINDFEVVYNKKDNVFNTQNTSYIEIMVKHPSSCEFTVTECRFIEVERTKPRDFSINAPTVDSGVVEVIVSKSLFAEGYQLSVSDKKNDYEDCAIFISSSDPVFHFNANDLTAGIPYYLRAVAVNELGQTICVNDNMVMYVSDENLYIVTNFDYETQAELNVYLEANLKIHQNLTCELTSDQKCRITSGGEPGADKSWEYFIFKLDPKAHEGKTKLVFEGDFSNYHGTRVCIQLCDASNRCYSYDLDLSASKTGEFVIDFEDFINSGNEFPNDTLIAIHFNFSNAMIGDVVVLASVRLEK